MTSLEELLLEKKDRVSTGVLTILRLLTSSRQPRLLTPSPKRIRVKKFRKVLRRTRKPREGATRARGSVRSGGSSELPPLPRLRETEVQDVLSHISGDEAPDAAEET